MKKKSLIFSSILGIALNIMNIPLVSSKSYTAMSCNINYLPNSLAPIVSKVMPSVVTITALGVHNVESTKIIPQLREFFNDDACSKDGFLWKDSPFCESKSENVPFISLGTGVIINARKGYVVTNNHVINNTNKIRVQLSNGHQSDAKLIGKDQEIDLAVLQIKDVNNLTEIKFSDSDKIHVGDYSIAIGNPYGLRNSVTAGIISALGRSNHQKYGNYIQTDTPLTIGNSGGPLININGELIGINTSIYGISSGPNMVASLGVGFAIPANMVNKLTSQIIQYGSIKRGLLGIIGQELNPDLVKDLNINIPSGFLIKKVMPKSSAAISGIKSGDIIISLNGKPIYTYNYFKGEIATLRVGTKVSLGLLRNRKKINVIVLLEAKLPNQKTTLVR
ncbi:MAG: trypsin-like peptidase domain-containing protein [Candidatus Dasytiphilus stammeri]